MVVIQSKPELGGAVAEWSEELLVKEKIYETQKIPVSPPARPGQPSKSKPELMTRCHFCFPFVHLLVTNPKPVEWFIFKSNNFVLDPSNISKGSILPHLTAGFF